MEKVIVVEDNLLITAIYRHYLTALNYTIVAEVTTGEEAIEVLKDNEVDLIIMDIMLEGEINGIEAMKEIRKKVDVPVIFVSANSDDTHFNNAMDIPNSMFLVKPITEPDLSNAVQMMTSNKGVA